MTFSLKFAPDVMDTSIASTGAGDTRRTEPLAAIEGPSIFAALQGQLGLNLDAGKGTVQILVVDHLEQPAGN